jgi:hypothetical protein
MLRAALVALITLAEAAGELLIANSVGYATAIVVFVRESDERIYTLLEWELPMRAPTVCRRPIAIVISFVRCFSLALLRDVASLSMIVVLWPFVLFERKQQCKHVVHTHKRLNT